jgi:enamine deaminase RidA (YjgF/YER057c/UK114 family)
MELFLQGKPLEIHWDGRQSRDFTYVANVVDGNIRAALAQADSALEDVVRVQIFVGRAEDFMAVAPIVGKHFADIRPANTTLVTGFVDPRIKIEIEVTAKKRGS